MNVFYYNFKNKVGLAALFRSLVQTKLWRVRIDEYDEKTRQQEEKYHAMLGDIAKQAMHLNQVLSLDDWKRLCVHQFKTDCIANNIPKLAEYWLKQNFRLMPSLDGSGLVALGTQTRDFPKYVAAGFIEWLYFYGSQNNIEWSEPEKNYNESQAA